MKIRFVHVSDLHFGPPHRSELDDALRLWVERERPDALLVSGDLTQRARPEQFEAARRYLESFSLPQVVVPGNHDISWWRFQERLLDPMRSYARYFSSLLEPALQLPYAWIFGLNTAKGFTVKNGIFREEALQRLEAFFQRAPSNVLRVVVAHHHLLPAPGPFLDPVATRAREAVYSFNRAKIDLVTAGHLHHGFLSQVRDYFPGLAHRTLVVHAGTSMSSRGRGPEHGLNSLNLIAVDDEQITIDQCRHVGGEMLFESVARYTFPRAGSGLAPKPQYP